MKKAGKQPEVGSLHSRGAARREKPASAKLMLLNNSAGEVTDMGEVLLIIITNTARVIPYIAKTAAGTSFLRAR